MNKIKTAVAAICGLAAMGLEASAQTWIWYPGDYEIWLGNEMNNRRTERGTFFPPFWKQDSHYVSVEFSTTADIAERETLTICAEGRYNVKIDGRMLNGMPRQLTLEPGQHKINIKVYNQATPPALFVDGRTVKSGPHWKATFEDKEWIDESGKASDTSATTYVQAGSWNFDSATARPSAFRLERKHQDAVARETAEAGNRECTLYDFGRETFGFVKLSGVKIKEKHNGETKGRVLITYGESREEALDRDRCETIDEIELHGNGSWTDLMRNTDNGAQTPNGTNSAANADTIVMEGSKAFRYVGIWPDENTTVGNASMDYEFMPEAEHGTFRCSDDLVNHMWNVGVYTLQLTTREFFIDGIKRDRWVWSGDASQSYLMNYYLFADNEEVKRTMWLLGGKTPITSHINTIMDYTFYWLISVYDYYLYTADADFVRQIYPTMLNYVEFIDNRLDQDGMAQGLTGDWVFVDWADKPMDKQGQLSFEQILLCQALKATAGAARVSGDDAKAHELAKRAELLQTKIHDFFWDEAAKALVHNRREGKKSTEVFKFSNMFAIIFNLLSPDEQKSVMESVMLNDSILKITTPYMRFYEMEALCQMGETDRVMREMRDYWGGMLREGATTFWEKYVPTDKGAEHLQMYGRPYGKSLCHAWGASPIYLLGKYFLGVRPTKPGYEEYVVEPHLADLAWMEGTVPTPFGSVSVRVDKKNVMVKADGGRGTLLWKGKKVDIPAGKEIRIKR